VRRDALNDLKEALKEKLINEDQERQAHQQVQDLTDRFVGEIDRVCDDKQKEILEF
jgi:ribosome recycling factor